MHNVVVNGEQHKRVDARVLFTRLPTPDAVDGVAAYDQHNNRGDASVLLLGTTNPQQIEVVEFALIVAGNGDNGGYSRRFRVCGRSFRGRRDVELFLCHELTTAEPV